MKKHLSKLVSLIAVFSMMLSACTALNGANTTGLIASGTISAREVNIASQIGGQVVSVSVEEGAQVNTGDELFRLDDSLLMTQRAQAEAAVAVAQAGLITAQVSQIAVQAQYDLVFQNVLLQDAQARLADWQTPAPDEFLLPVWYFQDEEEVQAAREEVDAAQLALETEQANLQGVLENVASSAFITAEIRLANAQAAFLIAQEVLTQTVTAQDNADLQASAMDLFDAAMTELDAAQLDYDRLLTSTAATDVREARARLAIAQARSDAALDRLNQMLTGDQSLQLTTAQAGVDQADAAVGQAEAMLTQIQAALAVIDAQLAKTVVYAPVSGVVLNRNLEVGEIVTPGGIVVVIGQLEEVELIVYIPETEYGNVNLGDEVSITVDSFPGETFSGTVVHISDQAEFTPRNVQTVEGRQATVYAIKLSVPNANLKLKPGMPADVTFSK